jgi:hypothetical protein
MDYFMRKLFRQKTEISLRIFGPESMRNLPKKKRHGLRSMSTQIRIPGKTGKSSLKEIIRWSLLTVDNHIVVLFGRDALWKEEVSI